MQQRHRVRSSIIEAVLVAVGDIHARAGISIKERQGTETQMALPEPSAEDRAAALGKAMAARRARAELTAQLKQGSTDLVDVLQDAETRPTAGSMRVSDLLGALPTVGNSQARQIMTEIGIAPTRRIRSLTQRQRAALLARFSRPGEPRPAVLPD
jgi:hypothetical protein